MKHVRIAGLLTLSLLAGAVLTNASSVSAAGGTATWTDATGDHKFSTAGNWVENAIPEAGDKLIFDTVPGGTPVVPSVYSVNNDVAVAFSGVETQGAALTNVVNLQLQNDLQLTAGSYWRVAENTKKLAVTLASGKTLQVAGDFAFETGYLPAFHITNGVLTLKSGVAAYKDALISGASSVVVENGASLECLAHLTDYNVTTPITLGGGAGTSAASLNFTQCSGGGSLDPALTLNLSKVTLAANAEVQVWGNDTIHVTELVANGHTLTRSAIGDGTLVLPTGTQSTVYEPKTTQLDGDAPTDAVIVYPNETAILNGARGSVFVRAGGILKGSGTLSDLSVSGTVSPGNSPGTITMTSLLSLAPDSVYIVEVASKDSYDRLIANGVSITDAILDLRFISGATVSAGDVYTIISNTDGSNPVTGTFKNLPEGATFTVLGGTFKVSYVGGDGNDVTLTVVTVPSVPNTGFELQRTNPVLIAAVTVVMAGALLVVGRRMAARR